MPWVIADGLWVHFFALQTILFATPTHTEYFSDWFREKTSAALFFKYNSQLGPPYQVLVDTNFINFSIKNKVGCFSSCAAIWAGFWQPTTIQELAYSFWLTANHELFGSFSSVQSASELWLRLL